MPNRAQQATLSFVGRPHMSDARKPSRDALAARAALSAAMDRAEDMKYCLDGFAVLMSTDPSRLSGDDANGKVEALLAFLLRQQEEAMAEVRQLTCIALDGGSPS